jgi:hypothetical protein
MLPELPTAAFGVWAQQGLTHLIGPTRWQLQFQTYGSFSWACHKPGINRLPRAVEQLLMCRCPDDRVRSTSLTLIDLPVGYALLVTLLRLCRAILGV